MTLDWKGIIEDADEDDEFAPLPAGTYPVKVVNTEVKQASTGSSMIAVQAKVQGGQYDARSLWTNFVFKTESKPGMAMTLRKLTGIGITREWLVAKEPTIHQIASALDGREAIATVIQKEYQGEQRNDIKGFKPLPGGSAAPSVGPVSSGAVPDVPPPPPNLDEMDDDDMPIPPPPVVEDEGPDPF